MRDLGSVQGRIVDRVRMDHESRSLEGETRAMIKPSEPLVARLRAVFMDFHAEDSDPGKEKACGDFVFHMTDWIEELERLSRLYSDPLSHNEEEVRRAVTGFLYHACGHIIQAARLYDYVPDPFGEEREERKKT